MSWASNDGGEHGSGSIVSGETGLAHAGAIVDYESGNILVAHVDGLCGLARSYKEIGTKTSAHSCSQKTDERMPADARIYLGHAVPSGLGPRALVWPGSPYLAIGFPYLGGQDPEMRCGKGLWDALIAIT